MKREEADAQTGGLPEERGAGRVPERSEREGAPSPRDGAQHDLAQRTGCEQAPDRRGSWPGIGDDLSAYLLLSRRGCGRRLRSDSDEQGAGASRGPREGSAALAAARSGGMRPRRAPGSLAAVRPRC